MYLFIYSYSIFSYKVYNNSFIYLFFSILNNLLKHIHVSFFILFDHNNLLFLSLFIAHAILIPCIFQFWKHIRDHLRYLNFKTDI